VIVTESTKGSKAWQREVKEAAHEAMGERPLFTGPLEVTFDFYIVRPAGHYGTGRNAALLRPSAPAYPAKRPDLLKYARGVEDACTGVVWRDDSLIVQEHLAKHYANQAHCIVRVWDLTKGTT